MKVPIRIEFPNGLVLLTPPGTIRPAIFNRKRVRGAWSVQAGENGPYFSFDEHRARIEWQHIAIPPAPTSPEERS